MEVVRPDICVIIPTFSAKNELRRCIVALEAQQKKPDFSIIIVDNGADAATKQVIRSLGSDIIVLHSPRNHGFAGGVNIGIRYALDRGYSYIALLNDDAEALPNWLKELHQSMVHNKDVGIVTGKMLTPHKKIIDSAGEGYSIWGLPFPRGRGELDKGQYNKSRAVFGASGGASMYRKKLFVEIGLFDEDFFAYYEDVDLSFRAQLAGWKVLYTPRAVVHHQAGTTSSKIRGFVAYHSFKNLPLLLWKNVPMRLLPRIIPRFALAHLAIFMSSLAKGQGIYVLKGFGRAVWLMPKVSLQRHAIQKKARVSDHYINSLLLHDLPPGATRLRRLRAFFVRRG